MSGHPDDVWVDVSGFDGPELLLATDGREAAITRARALYVNDRIDIDELERQIEAALGGRLISPAAALKLLAPPKPSDSLRAVRS